MAILKPPSRDSILPKVIPLTPLNLYIERVKSVTEAVRSSAAGYEYIPLQFGGISGQQQSLLANSTVKIIDFKVSGS